MVHLDQIADTLVSVPEVAQAHVFAGSEPSTQLTAVVFTAGEAVNKAASVTSAEVESRVFRACQRGVSRSLASYERVDQVRLTDQPLPVTPLGKIRTALVSREPSFDMATWLSQVS